MKKIILFAIPALLLAACGGSESSEGNTENSSSAKQELGTAYKMETLDTRIGNLSFTHDFANGYPVNATQKLHYHPWPK